MIVSNHENINIVTSYEATVIDHNIIRPTVTEGVILSHRELMAVSVQVHYVGNNTQISLTDNDKTGITLYGPV